VEATFFATPGAFRAWLVEHHETADALVVGFHRAGSGRPTLTWQQSIDEALCFGWIDGIVQRIDETRYSRRFTPRRPRSIWSNANIRRFGELSAMGRARPAGERAFAARTEERSGVYGHERTEDAVLEPAHEERLRADAAAWAWFSSQPESYRRLAIHWVAGAKRQDTRDRRIARLIEDSAAGRRMRSLDWTATRPPSGGGAAEST